MMISNQENPPYTSSSHDNIPEPQGTEAEPTAKYPIHWEREQSSSILERSNFLELAIGTNEEPSPEHLDEHQQEFHNLLEQWEERWPEHHDIIRKLHEVGAVQPIIGEAYLSGEATDKLDLVGLQGLSSKIIEDLRYRDIYEPNNDQKNWTKLSESDKRSVRLAEMILFMADAARAGIDAKKGLQPPGSLRSLASNMATYAARNTDVPESYKKFLRGAVASIRNDLQKQELTTPKGQRQSMTNAATEPQTQGPSAEKKDDHGQESDTINMKFNPATGAYETEGSAPDTSAPAGPEAPPGPAAPPALPPV